MPKQEPLSVRELARKSANKKCFDCSRPGPQNNVCLTFGTFVCTNCAGILRSFEYKVKSISMTDFSSDEVALMSAGGNKRARKKWLATYDEAVPNPDALDKIKEKMRLTYQVKKWYKSSKKTSKQSAVDSNQKRTKTILSPSTEPRSQGDRRQNHHRVSSNSARSSNSPLPRTKSLKRQESSFNDDHSLSGLLKFNDMFTNGGSNGQGIQLGAVEKLDMFGQPIRAPEPEPALPTQVDFDPFEDNDEGSGRDAQLLSHYNDMNYEGTPSFSMSSIPNGPRGQGGAPTMPMGGMMPPTTFSGYPNSASIPCQQNGGRVEMSPTKPDKHYDGDSSIHNQHSRPLAPSSASLIDESPVDVILKSLLSLQTRFGVARNELPNLFSQALHRLDASFPLNTNNAATVSHPRIIDTEPQPMHQIYTSHKTREVPDIISVGDASLQNANPFASADYTLDSHDIDSTENPFNLGKELESQQESVSQNEVYAKSELARPELFQEFSMF